jgi:hypothetical protein
LTLLALLAIPSFVALCFLAIAHTLQTMNLRLAEWAPLPAEALLQEYFPAAPPIRTAKAVAARARTYERLLENCTARSYRSAFSMQSNAPRFSRSPASFLREHRRNGPDLTLRTIAGLDPNHKPSAVRSIFERRRPRLGALIRRPRTFSTACLSYS